MVQNVNISFFRFVTMHAFDRQTDGQTEFSSYDRVCIPCSAVKMHCLHSSGAIVVDRVFCHREMQYYTNVG